MVKRDENEVADGAEEKASDSSSEESEDERSAASEDGGSAASGDGQQEEGDGEAVVSRKRKLGQDDELKKQLDAQSVEMKKKRDRIHYKTLARSCRNVVVEVKKARTFEIRKVTRKLAQARQATGKTSDESGKVVEGENNDNDDDDDDDHEEGDEKNQNQTSKKVTLSVEKLENRLKIVQTLNHHGIAKKFINAVGVEIPEQLNKEWMEHIKEKPELELTEEAYVDYKTSLLARIRQLKGLVTAMRVLEEQNEKWIVRNKRFKNQRRKMQRLNAPEKDRPIQCQMGECQARFRTPEARAEHWRKRHAHEYERMEMEGVDVNDADVDVTDINPKKKKNRMGQRERKRLAMEKQFEVRREAIMKGETPPPRTVEWNNKKKKKVDVSAEGEDQQVTDNGVTEPQEEEKLHPSWEAKRKMQMQASMLNEEAFQGKKITFDDSDSE